MSPIEFIRKDPGKYLGRIGDGSDREDGIYRFLTGIITNSVDEFTMGYGEKIIVDIKDGKRVIVRDNGRGIPLNHISFMFDGTYRGGMHPNPPKYSITNTVIVNALSSDFRVSSFREGRHSWGHFNCGVLVGSGIEDSDEENGTLVEFQPDETIFGDFAFDMNIVKEIIIQYTVLNQNLAIVLNGTIYGMR